MIKIEPARPIHVKEIVDNLRQQQDLEDTKDTLSELASVIRGSHCAYTGWIDSSIACIWGCIPGSMLDHNAFVWMVTTKVCDEHPFIIARYSRIMLDNLPEHFTRIGGLVDRKFKRSIRWLKWLGFDIYGPYAQDERYMAFRMRRA